jgi:hypothetical protein
LELPAEAPLGGATTVAPCTKGYKIGATSRSATNGGATKVASCAKGLNEARREPATNANYKY